MVDEHEHVTVEPGAGGEGQEVRHRLALAADLGVPARGDDQAPLGADAPGAVRDVAPVGPGPRAFLREHDVRVRRVVGLGLPAADQGPAVAGTAPSGRGTGSAAVVCTGPDASRGGRARRRPARRTRRGAPRRAPGGPSSCTGTSSGQVSIVSPGGRTLQRPSGRAARRGVGCRGTMPPVTELTLDDDAKRRVLRANLTYVAILVPILGLTAVSWGSARATSPSRSGTRASCSR